MLLLFPPLLRPMLLHTSVSLLADHAVLAPVACLCLNERVISREKMFSHHREVAFASALEKAVCGPWPFPSLFDGVHEQVYLAPALGRKGVVKILLYCKGGR